MSCAKSSISSPHHHHNTNHHDQIGGGAINEKKRDKCDGGDETPMGALRSETAKTTNRSTNFNPEQEPSHLMHAIFGLDRYPNYISRWGSNLEDTDKLERALEQQLAKIRRQKQQLLRRNEAMYNLIEEAKNQQRSHDEDEDGSEEEKVDWNVLTPPSTWEEVKNNVLDPRATKAIFGSKQFKSLSDESASKSSSSTSYTVQSILDGEVIVKLDLSKLQDWLEEECFDVYSFPLLSKTFCKRLKKATKTIVDYYNSRPQSQNNDDNNDDPLVGLGRRPIDLDLIGAYWINDLLFHLVIRPLSRELFQTTEQFQDLDWRHGYIAGYSSQPSEKKIAQRHRLISHTDDSEVTLNVGMGDEDFTGGDLRFWNLRGTKGEGTHVGDFHPQMGHALLHSGRHLHEVTQVESGDRYAYIIWARSWGSIRANTCPCCWTNRRQKDSIQKVKNRCVSSA